jgi:uncharacterized membrane protein YphA (DoxX/SURF4 family)
MAKDDGGPSTGLVMIRCVSGMILFLTGWHWIQGGGVDAAILRTSVQAAVPDLHEALARWGQEVLLWKPALWAELWQWGALVCGGLLLIGALVRPIGFLCAFALANAMLFGPHEARVLFVLLCVCSLACAMSRAGRRLGLDAIFDQHFPSWMTWSRGAGSASTD